MKYWKRSWVLLFVVFFMGCDSDNATDKVDNFDRKAMLSHWADDIIIPAYVQYQKDLQSLKEVNTAFSNDPTKDELSNIRQAWQKAYLAWQRVAMFDIGKAEEINLRNFTNIYPTDTSQILTNITSKDYNLELPSTNDEQGFPAIDFMLNGLDKDDNELLSIYNDSDEHAQYLTDLITRLNTNTDQVLNDWQATYRDAFVENNGGSATSSTNKLINDYMFYYEKFLRAGKVGIPAGVFSGSSDKTSVEAYYKNDISKLLLLQGLETVQHFFNGQGFDPNVTGPSIKSYLDELDATIDGEPLSEKINSQFEQARTTIQTLNNSFSDQLEDDIEPMLETYDALQKAVVLLKVDMFQALNIRVDFVDADGD